MTGPTNGHHDLNGSKCQNDTEMIPNDDPTKLCGNPYLFDIVRGGPRARTYDIIDERIRGSFVSSLQPPVDMTRTNRALRWTLWAVAIIGCVAFWFALIETGRYLLP